MPSAGAGIALLTSRVLDWAKTGLGEDKGGLRTEFLQLVETARSLKAH